MHGHREEIKALEAACLQKLVFLSLSTGRNTQGLGLRGSTASWSIAADQASGAGIPLLCFISDGCSGLL